MTHPKTEHWTLAKGSTIYVCDRCGRWEDTKGVSLNGTVHGSGAPDCCNGRFALVAKAGK